MNNAKPQRKQIRLQNYDYSQNGYYFVTICTKNREHMFGEIKNGVMVLNHAGEMLNTWWNKLPNKYQYIVTDILQIMPNHIHGIIQIVGVDPRVDPDNGNGQTHRSAPTTTLGTIIQWFKTMSTNEYIRNVKQNDWPAFDKRLWQRNYYEHIIRTENDLKKIRQYIQLNPQMWERDRNNRAFQQNDVGNFIKADVSLKKLAVGLGLAE